MIAEESWTGHIKMLLSVALYQTDNVWLQITLFTAILKFYMLFVNVNAFT